MQYRPLPFTERLDDITDQAERAVLDDAITVAQLVRARGGRALVVGGFVRDDVLNTSGNRRAIKDVDIEVYGVPLERLMNALRTLPRPVNIVGAQFGVIKYGGLDIAIPRRDSKTGKGHRGFMIDTDPGMSITEAARRRDLTINTMSLDPLTGEYFDPYGGLADLQARVLRATDPVLFADDPLRVLRVMQFAARFECSIDSATAELCRGMPLRELPKERIGEEWRKMLLKSRRPGIGLQAARELGIVRQLHPELQALIRLQQEPEWHPEGDVWNHTVLTLNEAAAIVRREDLHGSQALVILLGALCHDLGKATTTIYSADKGRIISYEHEAAGAEPTRRFLAAIDTPHDLRRQIVPLVTNHLFPALAQDAGNAAIRRLAVRLHPATIQQLVWVAEADHHGRALPWDGFPHGARLLQKAAYLTVHTARPQPLVQGRDLIAAGLSPGPDFGAILRDMFEAQQDGIFTTHEGGVAYLHRYLARR